MAAIQPEVVAILIQDENFTGQPGGQHPFPFGHDGFSRADDSNHGVVIGCQQTIQLFARATVGIIGNAIDASSVRPEMLRQASVAGDQVGLHIRMNIVQAAKQILEKIAPPAFNQQYAGEGRNASAEKVAQSLLFHVRGDRVLCYFRSKKAETGVEKPGSRGSSII